MTRASLASSRSALSALAGHRPASCARRDRLLGLHVGVLGRGMVAVLLAAAMVSMLLYATFDLDGPTRGLIQVPDTSLAQLRASMNLPPAAGNHP